MVFYNLIRFGSRHDFSYEILVQSHGDNEKVFRDLDITIHVIPCSDPGQYQKALSRFFEAEKFDVVHTHMHEEMPLVLHAAQDAGVRCRVAHSHNARLDIPRFVWPLLYFKHHRYERYATDLFGCSSLALQWLFPASWRDGHIINNGIDLSKFRFDAETRRQMRLDNGIAPSTKVFINVGRATAQKNQDFILNLAAGRRDRDELYIIIGEGPLLQSLSNRCEAENLTNVRLLGKRTDVDRLLCAADVFLFPSVYEGLGIVAVEAEASGLMVIASDTIPSEADMHLGNFDKASLKDTARWQSLMDRPPLTDSEREKISLASRASDYDITTVAAAVEEIYRRRLSS